MISKKIFTTILPRQYGAKYNPKKQNKIIENLGKLIIHFTVRKMLELSHFTVETCEVETYEVDHHFSQAYVPF